MMTNEEIFLEEEEELDFTDWWDRLDDIEREEYSRLETEYEEEGE